MAFHAQNRINPSNYEDVDIPLKDGRTAKGCQYVPPKEEDEHFAPLQEGVQQRAGDVHYSLLVNGVLDRPDQSSLEIADQVVAWAKKERPPAQDEDGAMAMDQAVIGAATIAMRDGTPELRAANAAWAESVFAKALTEEPDIARQMREGLQYNPVAMAFAGRAFALRDTTPTREDFKRLLDMAAGDAAASRGAGPAAETLCALNPRLPRVVLRIAFAASVGVVHEWDATEEEKTTTKAAKTAELEQRIEAELTWLFDDGPEPPWPPFPVESVPSRERHFIRLGPAPDEDEPKPTRKPVDRYVNHQTAAVWLRALWRPANDPSWLRDFVAAYTDWTLVANGAGLGEREEITERPREWNRVFFAVFAECLKGVSVADMEAALAPILVLHRCNFFDVTADVIRSLDVVFFNDAGIEPDVAVTARRLFAEKLGKYYSWRSLRGTKSDGVEMHLGPAGAVMFFNEHDFGQSPRCYLPAAMVERSLVFIPVMQTLATAAPSPFVAIILMNYLEALPKPEQLPLLLAFAEAAVAAYPDDRSFWIDHGIGRRVCRWLDGIRTTRPEVIDAARGVIELLLAKLVAIGVVEAHNLEIALNAGR